MEVGLTPEAATIFKKETEVKLMNAQIADLRTKQVSEVANVMAGSGGRRSTSEIKVNKRVQVSHLLIYQAPACSTDLSSAGMFY